MLLFLSYSPLFSTLSGYQVLQPDRARPLYLVSQLCPHCSVTHKGPYPMHPPAHMLLPSQDGLGCRVGTNSKLLVAYTGKLTSFSGYPCPLCTGRRALLHVSLPQGLGLGSLSICNVGRGGKEKGAWRLLGGIRVICAHSEVESPATDETPPTYPKAP